MVIRCKSRSEISPNRISSDIVKVVIHFFFRSSVLRLFTFFLSSGEIDFLTGGLDGNNGTGRKVDLVISPDGTSARAWGHGASSTSALLEESWDSSWARMLVFNARKDYEGVCMRDYMRKVTWVYVAWCLLFGM